MASTQLVMLSATRLYPFKVRHFVVELLLENSKNCKVRIDHHLLREILNLHVRVILEY
jgi:hypothetical protein